MQFKDYYKTLGVFPTATLQEIKIAYRKLSKKFHPDINDGDKFFEERFKEIQEAYEVLSNSVKRNNYDFKWQNEGNKNSFSQNSNNDFFRKREEEFEKQKEAYKKWEESLRKKEEELKSKPKSEKIYKKFGVIALVSIFFSIVIIVFLRRNIAIDTGNSSAGVFTQNDTTEVASNTQRNTVPPFVKTNIGNKTRADQLLKDKLSNSRLARIFSGTWKGNAFQYNIRERWKIILKCDLEKNEFKISYPSLDCSGVWYIEDVSENAISFREHILSGICIEGGLVKLKIINERTLGYYVYLADDTTLGAKGIIKKM